MPEDFQNRKYEIRLFSQQPQRLLAAAFEHTLHPKGTKSIDHIGCQTEGHTLGDIEIPALGSDEPDQRHQLLVAARNVPDRKLSPDQYARSRPSSR